MTVHLKLTNGLSKVGSAHVRLSNIVPAGRYSGQGQVVKFHLSSVLCLVSERPVFKTRVVGLNLCPPRHGHCPECLKAGVGRNYKVDLRKSALLPAVLSWLLLNLTTGTF